jgi:hypothetical protein
MRRERKRVARRLTGLSRSAGIASTAAARQSSKPAGDCYPRASVQHGMRGLAPVSGHPDDLANAAAELDRFIDDAGRLLTIQDGVDVEV